MRWLIDSGGSRRSLRHIFTFCFTLLHVLLVNQYVLIVETSEVRDTAKQRYSHVEFPTVQNVIFEQAFALLKKINDNLLVLYYLFLLQRRVHQQFT